MLVIYILTVDNVVCLSCDLEIDALDVMLWWAVFALVVVVIVVHAAR